jgi:hypothetical protein
VNCESKQVTEKGEITISESVSNQNYKIALDKKELGV